MWSFLSSLPQGNQAFVWLPGDDTRTAFTTLNHARSVLNDESAFGAAFVVAGDTVEFEDVSNVVFKADGPSHETFSGSIGLLTFSSAASVGAAIKADSTTRISDRIIEYLANRPNAGQ